MIRGVESSVQAMRSHLARQEVVARNLANLMTPGFKREMAIAEGHSGQLSRTILQAGNSGIYAAMLGLGQPMLGSMGTELEVERIVVDFSQGPLEETLRPLDLGLLGDGFIRVRTPDGDFYSRGGALQRDAAGGLVTAEGYQVLGTDGPIVLPDGMVEFWPDGSVAVDGVAVAQVEVVEFPAGTRMAKVSDGLYTPEAEEGVVPAEATQTEVKGGFLEGSNVDQVAVMTELVQSLRAYQASQRAMQAQDELLGKAVNEVGRV